MSLQSKPKQSRKKQPILQDEQQHQSHKPCTQELKKLLDLDFLEEVQKEDYDFRKKQINQIKAYLECCLSDKPPKHKVLMIEGSPGAGKSMCMNQVLSLQNCKIIEFNANVIKKIKQIEDHFNKKLFARQEKSRNFLINLKQYFHQQERIPIVLFIQEIEIILKRISEQALQAFFQSFGDPSVKLILIGITNTISFNVELQQKLNKRIKGMKVLIFEPYDIEIMIEMLKEKLKRVEQKLKISIQFPQKLLKFTITKLQSKKKGDIRQLVQFVRSLLVPLVRQTTKSQKSKFQISINQINEILTKSKGQKVNFINNIPYQQQILLTILYKYIKETQSLYITQKAMIKQIKGMCQFLQITFTKQMVDGLKELENYQFIKIRKAKGGDSKIALTVGLDEIMSALCDHPILKTYFEF